jgi:hypothetical protein
MKQTMSVPPKTRENAAHGVSGDIPGIADRPGHKVWPNYLKENGPNDQVQNNFAWSRRQIMLPEFQPSLHDQQHRQRAGHEEKIIEMIMQKRRVDMRLQEPAVERVQGASRDE